MPPLSEWMSGIQKLLPLSVTSAQSHGELTQRIVWTCELWQVFGSDLPSKTSQKNGVQIVPEYSADDSWSVGP